MDIRNQESGGNGDVRAEEERTSLVPHQVASQNGFVLDEFRVAPSVVTAFLKAPFTKEMPGVTYESLQAEVNEKYAHKPYFSPSYVTTQMVRLCENLGIGDHLRFSPDRLRQITVLDLGCGSEAAPSFLPDTWMPWLCRSLHQAGCAVTGVDICYPQYDRLQKGKVEDWNFHEVDLRNKGSLAVLKPNSFDVVHTASVLGHTDGAGTSPHLTRADIGEPHYVQIEQNIFEEVLRVLRPGGVFLVNSDCRYQKTGGPVEFSFTTLKHPNGNITLPYSHVDISLLQTTKGNGRIG